MPEQNNKSMNNGSEPASKLTKRELLVGMAIQGLLSNSNLKTKLSYEKLSIECISFIDALLKALEEKKQ